MIYFDAYNKEQFMELFKELKADGKIEDWSIAAFKENETVAFLRIKRFPEKHRTSNKYVYKMVFTFTWTNGKSYEYTYKDIYFKKLLDKTVDIITIRIRQAYQERKMINAY